MSLWTPDGEHEVRRTAPGAPGPADGPVGPDGPAGPPEELSEEDRARAEAMAQELSEARARLLETEVATVIANHALGIYELAAIHLTSEEPNFEEARLAIDALGVLVEGLEGRLGGGEPTLKDALHQIRLAFVQRSQESPTSG